MSYEIFLNGTNLRAKNPNNNAVPDEGQHQEQKVNECEGDVPQSSGRKERTPMRVHEICMLDGKVPS